jgi:hypothetical protein
MPGHAAATGASRSIEQERKYVLSGEQADALLAEARCHLEVDVHDPARPVAFARTTYLDTDDHEYLRSCVTGPVARRIRIREYGAAATVDAEPVLTGVAVLELKQSSGHMRDKLRLSAPAPVLARLCANGGRLIDGDADGLAHLADAQPLLAELGRDLRPCLTTVYRRVSLRGGNLRVTFDQDIAFSSPVAIGDRPLRPPVAGTGPAHLLELKLRGELPGWLARALVGVASANVSKFRDGMRALGHHLWAVPGDEGNGRNGRRAA